MTARYPLVLNGTDIQELQSGDVLIFDGASATFTGVDISGTLTVDIITGGSASFTGLSVSGAATFDDISFATGTVSILEFADADSSNFVSLKAPTTVASDVTFTLPGTDGTTGQAIVTDGAGNLSFSNAGITTGKAIAAAIVFGF